MCPADYKVAVPKIKPHPRPSPSPLFLARGNLVDTFMNNALFLPATNASIRPKDHLALSQKPKPVYPKENDNIRSRASALLNSGALSRLVCPSFFGARNHLNKICVTPRRPDVTRATYPDRSYQIWIEPERLVKLVGFHISASISSISANSSRHNSSKYTVLPTGVWKPVDGE